MKKIFLTLLFLGLAFAAVRTQFPKVQGKITKANMVTTTQRERNDNGFSFHLENSIDVEAKASLDLGPGRKSRRTVYPSANRAMNEPGRNDAAGATAAGPGSRVTAVRLYMEPDHYTGPCPGRITLVAEITTDGPGTVWYGFQAGAVSSSPEGTLTFNGAGTKTVSIAGRFETTPAVPEAAVIAIMEDEAGNHGPLTVSSEPVNYNILCSTNPTPPTW